MNAWLLYVVGHNHQLRNGVRGLRGDCKITGSIPEAEIGHIVQAEKGSFLEM